MKLINKLTAILCAGCIVSCCAYAGEKDMGIDKVDYVQKALDVRDVKVGGFLGDRLERNVGNRLLPFDIEGFIRMVEDRRHRDWWWIGEQPGKWLETAIISSENTGNKELRKKAEQILERYISAQGKDGYLGITDPGIMTERQPFRGMDPYELYFTFHALLTAHDMWGNEDSLVSAKKLADFFIERISPGKGEFWPLPNPVTLAGHSVHYSWEGTLLCDPVMRLYRKTGERKYLEWVEWIVGSIDRWSNCDSFSRLDKVSDGTMGIHEVQPYVHAHTFHMNFLGFLQMYQVTGDKSYLRKVEGAWSDIVERQRYITGGVSVGEHYTGGHLLPNTGMVVETCATMSWMILCQRLLELTGEPKYADAIETLLWNHLPAAQTWDGDGWRYHTPLIGWKPEKTFTGHDCCSASGPRIMSMVPMFFYGQNGDTVYVNQYGPSSADITLPEGRKVAIKQETTFPDGEEIILHVSVDSPSRFGIKIRIPYWCDGPTVKVNGKAVHTFVPPSYVTIRRQWSGNDKISIRLPMMTKWVAGMHTNEGLHALVRGPVVNCLDSVWFDEEVRKILAEDGTEGEPLKGLSGVITVDDNKQISIRRLDTPERILGPVWEVDIVLVDGSRHRVKMVPFANLGRWYRNEADMEDRHARIFPYGVWLPSYTGSSAGTIPE